MRRELGIARCGLACCLCTEDCAGCRSDQCPDAAGCENRLCSLQKGLEGCYACETICRKGILKKSKPRGFTLFARRYGVEALLDCLARNEENGVVYHRSGLTGDYDSVENLEALFTLIRTGKREPPAGNGT